MFDLAVLGVDIADQTPYAESGVTIFENGEPTGLMPGRLFRGLQHL